MSKGDTTVHVDFEVGGQSAAKMTVMDVYRAQQANASKVNEAARALAKEQGISFRDAKNAIRGLLAEERRALNEEAAMKKKADAQAEAEAASKEKARLSLAAQKSRALEQQFRDEERARKRVAEEAIRDAKRVAREELREAKRVAREKERDLKMQESQRGAIGSLLGRTAWGAAMGVAGYAGVAGVGNVIRGAVDGINQFVDKRADLERTAAPLMALGNNASNMKQVRSEIINIGATLGRTNEEVVGFLESMDSISGSMSPEKMAEVKKESMELAELFGTDLQTAMRLLAKTQITYGDSFDSMNQAQNKMLLIQDKADVSFSEMALRMPELMANAKPLGITFDEVGAAIMATTAALGSAENAFTGTRNAIMIIQDAEKEGIQLTGTLSDKLSQLYDIAMRGDQVLLELFKRDPLAAGATMVAKRNEIQAYIKDLEAMSSAEDLAADKIAQKFEDPVYSASRLRDFDKAIIENAPNVAADLNINNAMTRAMERFRAGQVAGSVASGGMFGVPTAFGLAAMFGNDSVVDEGNRMRLRKMPEDSLLRQNIIRDRVRYAYDQYQSDGTIDTRGMTPEEIKAANERSYFDVNAAYANQPSPERTAAREADIKSGIDESNQILKEIRDRLQPRDFLAVAKPGGGMTNNTETR